jgi:porin
LYSSIARCSGGIAAIALSGHAALAQTVPPAETSPIPVASESLWDRPGLFGDIGGLRTALGARGITLSLQETSEVLGNVTGGIRHTATYDGLTQLSVTVDTSKAVGLEGGTFNVSALQIHGRNLSQLYLDNVQTVSGIAANAGTRLWELWYEQSLLADRLDIKVGQQSLDQEFMVSAYGSVFVNSAFDWPVLAASDMPAGGPVYPLSALGVRVRAKASDAMTIMACLFDGNPAGSSEGDPPRNDPSGTRFNLHDGALIIAELQYGLNPAGDLPGTYKIGAWYNTGRFSDERYDNAAGSLADPGSNGYARQHRGDYSFYAMADQMIWRASPGSARGIGVFARVSGAPGDRNPISFSANAGLVLKAPFAGRDNDSVGLGFGYARYGCGARGLDRDTAQYGDPRYPVRGAETYVELTYQYQVAPWWTIQSDMQYIVTPAGGVQNPDRPAERIGNELVLGLRTNIFF